MKTSALTILSFVFALAAIIILPIAAFHDFRKTQNLTPNDFAQYRYEIWRIGIREYDRGNLYYTNSTPEYHDGCIVIPLSGSVVTVSPPFVVTDRRSIENTTP